MRSAPGRRGRTAVILRRYDERTVLASVSFSVKPGEKVGIIGDNGAGKSTLLRLIAGVDQPDNGELTVIAPGGVGYLAQSLALPPHASVQDAIDLSLADLRELMHTARPVLLDLADRPELRQLAGDWVARVDIRTAKTDNRPADALLIRPDGHVAWAATLDEPTVTAGATLREALSRWFGTPAEHRGVPAIAYGCSNGTAS